MENTRKKIEEMVIININADNDNHTENDKVYFQYQLKYHKRYRISSINILIRPKQWKFHIEKFKKK